MTPEQRIDRHKQTIEYIKEDIAWLKATKFHIKGASPATTDQLIERGERNIEMYEGFIAGLQEQLK